MEQGLLQAQGRFGTRMQVEIVPPEGVRGVDEFE
jgi:hypothetical protein